MNFPAEILQLQQYLWNQLQGAIDREQTVAAVIGILVNLARGLWFPVVLGLIAVGLVAMFYRPRIPRGSLWIPLFGIFGGTPTFYTHTRPASFCGKFIKARHRITSRLRRKT
jgi:hypothetical protein